MTKLHESLVVGITTWNRWEDLRKTLRILSESELRDNRIIVVDDASDLPLPDGYFEEWGSLKKLEYHRLAKNGGLVQARNHLASLVSEPYLLSLDDDSYPLKGSFTDIIKYLEAPEGGRVAVVAIPYLDGPNSEPRCHVKDVPAVTSNFAGGSNLMVMSCFNELGGYAKWIDRQCEESEFAMRAFAAGFSVVNHPAVLIRHDCVATQRNHDRIRFHAARNNLITYWLHAPLGYCAVKLALDGVRGLRYYFSGAGLGYLRGLISAITAIGRGVGEARRPMAYAQFRGFRRLTITA